MPLWHADADLQGVDAVVVPGGFSYGDYLRAGAIAAQAPVMRSVIDAARGGLPVLGICNGFQILCEAGLLPGVLVRNAGLKFVCRDQWLRVENTTSVWTSRYDAGAEILVPVKNAEGRYVADERTCSTSSRARAGCCSGISATARGTRATRTGRCATSPGSVRPTAGSQP